MSEKEAYETVQIPKVTVDYIKKQEHFKLYSSLDSFVMHALSLRLEELKRTGIMT